jgi:hypothetical protein
MIQADARHRVRRREGVLPGRGRPGGRLAPVLALLLLAAPGAAQHRKAASSGETVAGPPGAASEGDVIRLLEQATFGPTEDLVAHVRKVGFEAYLAEQFSAPASSYPVLPPVPASTQDGCPNGSPSTCVRDNYTMYLLKVAFFQNALWGEDQLRQRVALALHEILVVSGLKVRPPSAMARYLNMLALNAFGNYRMILHELTLNPAMGRYLDMVNNDKPNEKGTIAPNENYAREVLQLFSTGVYLLHPDGTMQLDRDGNPVPAYSQDTIEGLAHVFTGWTFAPLPGNELLKHNPPNYLELMWLFRDVTGSDVNHDKGAKQLLSYPGAVYPTIEAGLDGAVELERALDNIFHHPNVGPFIGRQLIQHLVTSNPSPAYVARVAAVFNDNGSGVRGDLMAVVSAILLDPEARGDARPEPDYGHLREPVLFITGFCRAFGAASDGILDGPAVAMGQDLFLSQSVFSYYPHSYQIVGTTDDGPEFGIQSTAAALARMNFVNALAFSKLRPEKATTGTSLDLSPLLPLAGDPALLVGALDRLLLHHAMSNAMKAAVTGAVTAVPATNSLLRAQTAVYLVASSSQYQVQR